MSAEQFEKLSLAEAMVTTRAGTARASAARRAPLQNLDQDQPVPSVESPASPTPSLVVSTNNLRYNVSAFDTNLRRRVKRGLEDNEIRMKYCAVSDDEDETKYFHLDDDITVAMGGNLRAPKCTCGANEKGIACKHIYWVGDQIVSTTPKKSRPETLRLSMDGSTFQDLKPADIVDEKGLEDVAEDLGWVFQDEDLPEDEEEMKDAIINMLSVFEPQDALPGEFKCPESPLTSERAKKYQEFAELFTQYATRDPGLFLEARNIIDPNFQSRVFFDKIGTRITRTFKALDKYIAHGPMYASPDKLRYDVQSCAEKLRALVNAIDEFYQQQDEDEPGTKDVAVRAGAALVRILDLVADRNANAYENITWGMETPSNPAENNLFVALIGEQDDDEPMFVLDALRALPQEDLVRNHWETLQSIEQKLQRPETPSDYTMTFRRVVYDSRKRAASEIRGGEAKRAMQE
ncbi:hypothetical protein P153DRAFT_102338 [Dothidotthia symphoricarpi CBS 119687]|uniref:SWIM-type domain-containing protein n=1 Tax=Dothidotthia symphoricarpi CBS 119687 TaxID=1392245 RepID=A0A6A6APY0_9PLEO|nr:uncharacterized protein P153DRAFT_102338 [Dothidotthia symphoricarpi CBS 119687]KAF2133979.1 hypothetical protein P153DRAFT_102338 [Dothidotthia symphoricarpi CBS 119687]